MYTNPIPKIRICGLCRGKTFSHTARNCVKRFLDEELPFWSEQGIPYKWTRAKLAKQVGISLAALNILEHRPSQANSQWLEKYRDFTHRYATWFGSRFQIGAPCDVCGGWYRGKKSNRHPSCRIIEGKKTFVPPSPKPKTAKIRCGLCQLGPDSVLGPHTASTCVRRVYHYLEITPEELALETDIPVHRLGKLYDEYPFGGPSWQGYVNKYRYYVSTLA